MRILYHHRTASKDGQAVHIEELIAALREQGHEVLVVGPSATQAEGMGAKVGWVHRLKRMLPAALYELLELAYSWVAYRRRVAAARAFRPHILYERYNLYLLAGVMMKRRFGLPLLLEVNAPLAEERERFGGLALRSLARWSERTVWRTADFVLPVTQVLAEHVIACDVPAERIVVIPNGINEGHFAQAPDVATAKRQLGLEGRLVLGFTGFVRDWHGVDRVVRWLAGPKAPAGSVLLVVGDGPARPDLEQLAHSLGVAERVRFTGVVAREKIPAHVAAFDVALQPAVVPYASPLKLFEYLALGKAVLAPSVPNLLEILTDGDNAVLFDPRDDSTFEAGLLRLCTDAGFRCRIAAGAARTIQARGLTWAENARRVIALGERAGAHRAGLASRSSSDAVARP